MLQTCWTLLCLLMTPTNFLHTKIYYLFQIVNQELENINHWFISRKPSIHIKKTKLSLFHKLSQKEDIPLLLPKMVINNYEIQRTELLKSFVVLLDQKLIRKENIK